MRWVIYGIYTLSPDRDRFMTSLNYHQKRLLRSLRSPFGWMLAPVPLATVFPSETTYHLIIPLLGMIRISVLPCKTPMPRAICAVDAPAPLRENFMHRKPLHASWCAMAHEILS